MRRKQLREASTSRSAAAVDAGGSWVVAGSQREQGERRSSDGRRTPRPTSAAARGRVGTGVSGSLRVESHEVVDDDEDNTTSAVGPCG